MLAQWMEYSPYGVCLTCLPPNVVVRAEATLRLASISISTQVLTTGALSQDGARTGCTPATDPRGPPPPPPSPPSPPPTVYTPPPPPGSVLPWGVPPLGPQDACTADKPGWADRGGDTCAVYVANGWCCPSSFPDCNADYNVGGYDSDRACCASCGTGQDTIGAARAPPPHTHTHLPSGIVAASSRGLSLTAAVCVLCRVVPAC